MITLTTAVPIPNVTRLQLAAPPELRDPNTVKLVFEARSTTGRRVLFAISARNTLNGSDRLKINPSPTSFDDMLFVERAVTGAADAADQIETASVTGANRAARMRNVEQKCLDLGLIDAALTGTVS